MNSNLKGVGPAPVGWPATISWEGFTGTTRSKLTSQQITEIIISMMTAAGIDPDKHVVPVVNVVEVVVVPMENVVEAVVVPMENIVEADVVPMENIVEADQHNTEGDIEEREENDINDNPRGEKRAIGS